MTSAFVALALGAVLAVSALAYVLYPIFFPSESTKGRLVTATTGQISSEEVPAVVALREIEFDRATGKLSDADYVQLKEQYTQEALAAMRSGGAVPLEGPPVVEDEIEAIIMAYRREHPECSSCGPRPEIDAIFCSTCGRYLAGSCSRCSAHIDESGARFCAACGHSLAA
jgi:Double zinc ribbon